MKIFFKSILRKYFKLVVTTKTTLICWLVWFLFLFFFASTSFSVFLGFRLGRLARSYGHPIHKQRQLTLIARQISRFSEFLEFRLNTFG